jgi:hypothetical protein
MENHNSKLNPAEAGERIVGNVWAISATGKAYIDSSHYCENKAQSP